MTRRHHNHPDALAWERFPEAFFAFDQLSELSQRAMEAIRDNEFSHARRLLRLASHRLADLKRECALLECLAMKEAAQQEKGQ